MCTTEWHDVRGGPVGVGEAVGAGLDVPAAALAVPRNAGLRDADPAVVPDGPHPAAASTAAPAAAARHQPPRPVPVFALAVSTQTG
jgi:hypothetical protein